MKNKNTIILFFTMIVVMMGFGIIIPILPFYIESFGASGKALGLLMAIFSIMQFIFAPIWGTLSDRFGRKPILVIGVLGNALSLLFFGSVYPDVDDVRLPCPSWNFIFSNDAHGDGLYR